MYGLLLFGVRSIHGMLFLFCWPGFFCAALLACLFVVPLRRKYEFFVAFVVVLVAGDVVAFGPVPLLLVAVSLLLVLF